MVSFAAQYVMRGIGTHRKRGNSKNVEGVKLQHPGAPDSIQSITAERKQIEDGYLEGCLFGRRRRSARLLDASRVVGAAAHVEGRKISENHVEFCGGSHC
jgi:hypothetical protein